MLVMDCHLCQVVITITEIVIVGYHSKELKVSNKTRNFTAKYLYWHPAY